jgi:predicted esterase
MPLRRRDESEQSPLTTAPVFLLHGADDSVVPASEMLSLARKPGTTTSVRAFASRLVTHAETNRGAALAEMWGLSGFWQELLAQ